MPRALGIRGSSLNAGVQALVAVTLCLAWQSASAQVTSAGAVNVLPSYFDRLIAPSQILLSPAPRVDDEQVSFLKKFDADDFKVTSFVSSREGAAAPDYRLYLGVGHKTALGSSAQMSSRAFYGTGTFDGGDPTGAALPDEVRASGGLPGEWLGADWKVESRVFSRHALSAGVEYRQEIAYDVLDLNTLLGRQTLTDAAEPERRIGFVTNDNVSLAQNLALNVRLRYDEATRETATAVAPRAELTYKPEQSSALTAVFDQSPNAPLSRPRAYNPWMAADSSTDRIRNYELGYQKSVSERNTLRLSAYRYAADGLLAQTLSPDGAAESASAEIDTAGFEVGMERNGMGGTRSRVSYAWQETTDWLAGTANGSLGQHLARMSVDIPILPKRLSTSFEVQYVDLVGPLIGDRDRDYVIGNLTLVGGTVSRDTHVTLGMHNVFDVRETGSVNQVLSLVPPDGRSVRIDVKRTL
jgi:hypothetical protein